MIKRLLIMLLAALLLPVSGLAYNISWLPEDLPTYNDCEYAYCVDDRNLGSISVWAWNATTSKDLYNVFPGINIGEPIAQDAQGNNIYLWKNDTDIIPTHIIFANNKGTIQTKDLAFLNGACYIFSTGEIIEADSPRPNVTYDFMVNGLCYNINEDGKSVTVTYEIDNFWGRYTSLNGNITIPSEVTFKGNKYTVISIGDYAFEFCSGLTGVTIPESVTTIGNRAFAYCNYLTSVSIPNSVTAIGNFAFLFCSSLTGITIPNSVTSIGNLAFISCSGLTSIKVASGNTKYDSRNNCNAIIETATNTLITGCNNTTIPSSITEIGEYAFVDCIGLTSVTIPNSVISIGEWAFQGCSGLTGITIPNSTTSIGYSAFASCSGLTSIKVASGNTKYDSRNNCNAIIETATNTLINGCKNTTIPNSITEIGEYAFDHCTGLTNVIIPNSVTTIGSFAFASCSNLTSVTIPNSVISIGFFAFENGTAWYDNQPDGLIYAGLVAYKYKGTMPSGTNIVIKDGTKGIAAEAFYYCSGMTSISIPNSVILIRERAFIGCSCLAKIEVASNNTKYDTRNNCNAIIETASNTLVAGCKNTTIPNSVTSIGEYAFSDCSGMTNVIIPNSVTSIGNFAFRYCSGLTGITIPNSVTSIGEGVFVGCSSFKNITIPHSITSIPANTFNQCSGLTSITIPNTVNEIGSGAFIYCTGLKNIESYPDPNRITIGSDVFLKVPNSATLHVLPKYKQAYSSAAQWNVFNIVDDLVEDTPSGDLNGDGNVNAGDVSELYSAILRGAADATYDLNGDGNVNAGDISSLYSTILGQ